MQVIKEINNNQEVFKNRIDKIGTVKVKILLIERFNRTRSKLRGFLIQIKLKI